MARLVVGPGGAGADSGPRPVPAPGGIRGSDPAGARRSGRRLSLPSARRAPGSEPAAPQLAVSQRAWVQGLQFLGEGFALAGISFLLARILAALRSGGGEVQQGL